MEKMIPPEPKEPMQGWPRWLGTLAVFSFFLSVTLCLMFLSPALFRLFPERFFKHPSAPCLSNLKQISLAIAMYADANGGRCPMDSTNPTLVESMQLLSNVVPSAKLLYCPSDQRPGARAEWDFKKLTSLNISYSYVPNLKWQDTPDSPLFLDRIYTMSKGSAWPSNGNHGDKGGNVGFNDGHVAWQNTLPATLKDKDGKEVVLSP